MLTDKFINRIMLTTFLLGIVCLMGGFGTGFFLGVHTHSVKNGKLDVSRCNEYTVLDASTVITACGDTIQYNWKTLKTYTNGR